MTPTLLLLSSLLMTEAGNQSPTVQYQVCDVVLNRQRDGHTSVAKTILQPHQFKHYKKGNAQTNAIALHCLSPSYKPSTPYRYFSGHGHLRFSITYRGHRYD